MRALAAAPLAALFRDLDRFAPLLPREPPDSLASLDPRLRLYTDGRVEIWYAPMGRRPVAPRLWILGITPGWRQMRIAYERAALALGRGLDAVAADALEKPEVAFAGSMRTNLVRMLDAVGMARALEVRTSAELFGDPRLRTGAVLKYPVFVGGRNYAGFSPAPERHPALTAMIEAVLVEELRGVGECPIVPLGRAADAVLERLAERGALDPGRVLRGFPHPSGANAHRASQFEARRADFEAFVAERLPNPVR